MKNSVIIDLVNKSNINPYTTTLAFRYEKKLLFCSGASKTSFYADLKENLNYFIAVVNVICRDIQSGDIRPNEEFRFSFVDVDGETRHISQGDKEKYDNVFNEITSIKIRKMLKSEKEQYLFSMRFVDYEYTKLEKVLIINLD